MPTQKQRRRAFLLYLAGSDAQGIFSTLADTGAATDYTALNGYFVPKVKLAFAGQAFHRIHQKEGETLLQLVTQLRKEVKDCNFGLDAAPIVGTPLQLNRVSF